MSTSRSATEYKALHYLGGKGGPSGKWVASLLPTDAETYVEPFAGMLGVLRMRPPAKAELANDLDGLIVNWWRVVRDNPEELSDLIERTSYARAEFEYQLTQLDHPDPVRRALATTVALAQNFTHSLNTPSWGRGKQGSTLSDKFAVLPETVLHTANRIKKVQLECKPANEILEWVAPEPGALIYCDPPYNTPASVGYRKSNTDEIRELCTPHLVDAKARIAISGYADEWDYLGWYRQEFETVSHALGNSQTKRPPRTEVLWTNYEPPGLQTARAPISEQLGLPVDE